MQISEKFDIEMFSVNILVLLYNKEISDSATVNSLLSHPNCRRANKVILWNNGPKKLNKKKLEYLPNNFEVIETIGNLALSKVYNFFIEECPSDFYIFFDDDSKVNNLLDFPLELKNFYIPIIRSNGRIESPRLRGIPVSSSSQIIEPSDRLVGIQSGLIISDRICTEIKSKYGDVFDSNFGLYGVDTSFFLRIKALKKMNKVCFYDGVDHDLSRLHVNQSEFRECERIIDKAIMTRRYPSLFNYRIFFISFTKLLANFKFRKIHLLIFYFLKGKHYKC